PSPGVRSLLPDYLNALGACQQVLGMNREAGISFRTAISIIDSSKSIQGDDGLLPVVTANLAVTFLACHHVMDSDRLARRAFGMVDSKGQSRLRSAISALLLSLTLAYMGKISKADSLSRSALDLLKSDTLCDASTLSRAFTSVAWVQRLAGNTRAAFDCQL